MPHFFETLSTGPDWFTVFMCNYHFSKLFLLDILVDPREPCSSLDFMGSSLNFRCFVGFASAQPDLPEPCELGKTSCKPQLRSIEVLAFSSLIYIYNL